jgi:hypothetical protein
MRKIAVTCVALLMVASSIVAAERPVAPNGIAYYSDFMKWKVVATSYREDKGQIRIITGNDIAVQKGHAILPSHVFWKRTGRIAHDVQAACRLKATVPILFNAGINCFIGPAHNLAKGGKSGPQSTRIGGMNMEFYL